MQKYIGTKEILATPMSRLAYNEYRGWNLPADENGEDAGFLVEYTDGGKPNDSRHQGYISWSPVDVFLNTYKPADTFIDRMRIEEFELGEKINKANEFLISSSVTELLTDLEQELLHAQLGAMVAYHTLLRARIGAALEKQL